MVAQVTRPVAAQAEKGAKNGHFNTRLPQPAQMAAGQQQGPKPVQQHANNHALTRAVRQPFDGALAEWVVAQDEGADINAVFRLFNQPPQGRLGSRTVVLPTDVGWTRRGQPHAVQQVGCPQLLTWCEVLAHQARRAQLAAAKQQVHGQRDVRHQRQPHHPGDSRCCSAPLSPQPGGDDVTQHGQRPDEEMLGCGGHPLAHDLEVQRIYLCKYLTR